MQDITAQVLLGRIKRTVARAAGAQPETCLTIDAIRFKVTALFANSHCGKYCGDRKARKRFSVIPLRYAIRQGASSGAL